MRPVPGKYTETKQTQESKITVLAKYDFALPESKILIRARVSLGDQ